MLYSVYFCFVEFQIPINYNRIITKYVYLNYYFIILYLSKVNVLIRYIVLH